jgi:hypothetical protein
LGDDVPGGFQALLEFRQPAADGLLEHPVRILLLLQPRLHPLHVGLEVADLDAALVRLDQLARRLFLGLVQRHLDAAKLDRIFGAELILVGLDVGDGHRHGRFDPLSGETDGAIPERRHQHQREEARHEKAERGIHANVDHANERSKVSRHGRKIEPAGRRFKGRQG